MRSNTDGISNAESNEQQRKWSENLWDKKAKDSLANYDPSRAHLNFEVTKGGIVQPIDKSKSIQQKMDEILSARGIKNPNARKDVRRKQRILAQMIFGGSRERMLEIAFGNQKVDFSKGADNSHLTRSKDIEKWAVEVYLLVIVFLMHIGHSGLVDVKQDIDIFLRTRLVLRLFRLRKNLE